MTAPDQIAITDKITLAKQGPSIHDWTNVHVKPNGAAGPMFPVLRREIGFLDQCSPSNACRDRP